MASLTSISESLDVPISWQLGCIHDKVSKNNVKYSALGSSSSEPVM